MTIELPNEREVQISVVHRVERAAEKVRAFLDRGEASDAYDLHWYGTRVLQPVAWRKLPGILRAKLSLMRIDAAEDIHARFDRMRANAQREWKAGQGLVIVENPPTWMAVDRQLIAFKRVTPQMLERRRG